MLLRVLGLTPKVNFINVLLASFTLADPNSGKKTDGFTVFFVLSGSSYEKAARWMLMKLTPDFVLKWNKREKIVTFHFHLFSYWLKGEREKNLNGNAAGWKMRRRWKFVLPNNQWSIAPAFYKQLLHAKIPKVQKDNDDLTVFCACGTLTHNFNIT